MKNFLRIVLYLSLVVGSVAAPSRAAVQAQESMPADTIQLLIQTEGPRQAVIDQVKALGGQVRASYKNVAAMAVAIPAGKLQALANTPGVVKVEKDRLISLEDSLYGKRSLPGGYPFVIKVSEGVKVKPAGADAGRSSPRPQGYASTSYTGAQEVWEETASGEGSVVAVVDSGVFPNRCLEQAVIGSPDYPNGFNATSDGIPANDKTNHWHGTIVAGVIASYCTLDFSESPNDPLYRAIQTFLPYPVDSVPLYGQAPRASIYPVKVFPFTGEATPVSTVLKGLDHILTLKKTEKLDIDIANLSFGGPTVYDGRDTLDRFVEAMMEANILVVAAAGNSGPTPNSVESPATSFPGLPVGAFDYALSSRIFYEYLGLVFGPDGDWTTIRDNGPGMGLVMRPTDELRVANFSSRGPTSDGRGAPAISALGSWNLYEFQAERDLYPAFGTSFSAPAASGAAALLNAYWNAQYDQDPPVQRLRDALLAGANPQVVGPAWRDFNDQGFGALDIPAALDKLIAGAAIPAYPVNTGKLKLNVLGPPEQHMTETYVSGLLQLAPGESFDAVFRIGWMTSQVKIEVFDIATPNNAAKAYWPNALEVHLQSAKRSGYPHPVKFYWYPSQTKKSFTITVEDGSWTGPSLPSADQPLERGLMKFSLAGDYSNQDPVKFKVRITRVNEFKRAGQRVFNKELKSGDEVSVPVTIKPGVTQAVFDLVWNRDWRYYPTSDFDMVVKDPYGMPASEDGATASAPEQVVITDPMPGVWTVVIQAIEAYKPDNVQLYVRRQ